MVGEVDATVTGIFKLLVTLNKDTGKPVKVQGVVEQLAAPYRGNIVGAMANTGLIKWESKGIYTINEFTPSQALAMAVRTACIQATSKGRAQRKLTPIEEYKPKPEIKVEREIIREQVNPFGFSSFDEIMIEKGTIIIGEYTLTGSFTLKRNIK
jgi:hypothetical protein